MARRSWTLRGIHLYVACLAALILLVVGVGQTVVALVDMVQAPPPVLMGAKPVAVYGGKEVQPPPELVEGQARVEAERQQDQAREPLRRLVMGLIIVAIGLPAYFYGWRFIRREERQGRWPQVEWNVRNLYFYLVSLGSFVALIIMSSILAAGVSQALVPMPAEYPGPLETHAMLVSEGNTAPTLSQVQARMDLERQRSEVMVTYYQRRGLLHHIVAMAMVLAVYLFHWVRCQKSFAALGKGQPAAAGPPGAAPAQ